ncbi:DnaJ domain-containing protein [Methyloceanibacter sp.]|uniref:DnaJ domain-containing protein n=1 Tax=Methyloceanibacter sp. TaxID=1965321 RepID=UPI002D70F8D4|nr:DnaJ domain-containing protein [Methyloceanibacter sp.]HZP08626.1 DnaJ domain-containing protein [Methyloceanibacter sp.]
MIYFLAGCAVLLLFILLGRLIAGADARKLAGLLRKMSGAALLAAAGFLTLRGALPLAIPLAVFGLALVGVKGLGLGGPFGSAQKSPGQASRVRTDKLEMELDHDSGRMDGKVLTGRFAGRALSSLTDWEAFELLDAFQAEGAQETALIEAYLDWRIPGWRDQTAEEDGSQPRGFAEEGPKEPPRGRARSSRMSVEEAYAVLGLDKGANEDAIRQAHRRLMMKLHPDQGGSNYLAARINEAKEVLLGRR